MEKKAHKGKTDKKSYRFRGRVWVEGAEGTFFGYGRIVLLQRIKEYGSITKAAKSMEISYKHAWDLVESMNRQGEKSLVESVSGGKTGGGTKLTPYGEKVVKLFWQVYAEFQKFLADQDRFINLINK